MSRLKIELICPAWGVSQNKWRRSFTPPLNLDILAGLAPEDTEISMTHESVEAIDFNGKIDLAAITVHTASAIRAYQIADEFRAIGVPVVLGGIHPSFMPDEAAVHADSVVIGEAENTWPLLIEDFEAGRLKKRYIEASKPDLAGLPMPRTDLFDKKNYLFPHQTSTSRGCPSCCKYCSVTSFFGGTYRIRPIEEVVLEIEVLKKEMIREGFSPSKKWIYFIDDNIIGQPSYALKLFQALIPLNIKWIGQAALTIAKNEELLGLAKKSGCMTLFIGFESINQSSLNSVKKKFNVVGEYREAIEKIHSYGISIAAGFMFGFDNDDESIFEKTVQFAKDSKLETADFNILTPYPGTEVYKEFEKADRIITKDWSKYDGAHAVFYPKRMSAETLERGYRWAADKFYTLPSILWRIGVPHSSLFKTLVHNLTMRAFYRSKAKNI